MKKQAYEIITEKLIDELGKGNVPWRKPWSLKAGQFPMSADGYQYNGINALILGLAPYSDARWVTFKKAQKLEGNIKRGEKGYPVVFYKHLEIEQENEKGEKEIKDIWIMRYYTVFNVEQCENLKLPPVDKENAEAPEKSLTADEIIEHMPNQPSISYDGGNRAYYRPSNDSIHLPKEDSFDSQDGMYATIFHELTHSTGHSSRVGRKGIEEPSMFGCEKYAKEELVAEFGASFLCHESGIKNDIPQHASYIKSWHDKLQNDPKLLITAASQGQKAANYILGKTKTS